MKKSILLILPVTIIFGFVYLFLDCKLYYYGESKFNICNYSLSLEMEPDYWGTDVCSPEVGLTVQDKNGFVIIAKDESYLLNNETIKVKKIIKYGFNTGRLIALVESEDKHQYYIECTENSDPKSKKDLQVNVFDGNIKLNSTDFKWIDYENDLKTITNLKTARAYSVLFFIFIISAIIFSSILIRKDPH